MLKYIDGTTQRFRMIKNESLGEYNYNTFFTFDDLFMKMADYLNGKVETFLERPLYGKEFPDRSATNQLMDSDKQLANKTVMPRTIIRYEINPMDEDLVDIPSLKTHFDMNNGLTQELHALRASRIKDNVIRNIDSYRDIDIAIYGNIAFTSAFLYLTVLTDNAIEAIELQKKLKTQFPLNVQHDVYRKIMKTVDTTGKVNNKGKITKELDLLPYEVKTVIPNKIISKLKESYGIADIPETDDALETLLKKYSFNALTREIDGSTRKPVWTTRYSIIPILVPTELDKSSNVKNMSNTHAVRMVFQLSYIEIVAYKLRCKYKVLSAENQNNYIENKEFNASSSALSVEVLKLEHEIDKCIRSYDFELAYEDMDKQDDGTMMLYLPDIVESRDKYFGKYMKYLNDSLVEDSKYYKVIIKHGSNQTNDINSDSSNGTYYSYDELCTFDEKSDVGDKIFVIFYINRELYEEWKVRTGIRDKENMSAKLMKR